MSFIKYFSAPNGAVTKEELRKYRIAKIVKDIIAMLIALLVLAGVAYMFIYSLVIGWL